MNGPNSAKKLSYDSVSAVLKSAERPLTVSQIARRLKASKIEGVHEWCVRLYLHKLQALHRAEKDTSERWIESEPHYASLKPDASPKEAAKKSPEKQVATKRSKTVQESRACERCEKMRVPGERFCEECRKAVKVEMDETGYLTPQYRGHVGDQRITEMRENVYETKHGTGHG